MRCVNADDMIRDAPAAERVRARHRLGVHCRGLEAACWLTRLTARRLCTRRHHPPSPPSRASHASLPPPPRRTTLLVARSTRVPGRSRSTD